MGKSIREAMDSAIERRALAPAALAFDLDRVGAFERFVVPLAPIAGQVADILTTREALGRGFVEANPAMKGLVRNVPAFVAVKIGVGALAALSVKKLQDAGHKNAARVVSALGTLAGAGPALHNIRLMNR